MTRSEVVLMLKHQGYNGPWNRTKEQLLHTLETYIPTCEEWEEYIFEEMEGAERYDGRRNQ